MAGATIGGLADQIASNTGGFVVAFAPGDNLSSTFRRVLEQFCASYVLYFTPHGVERAGSRSLEVRVKDARVEVRRPQWLCLEVRLTRQSAVGSRWVSQSQSTI